MEHQTGGYQVYIDKNFDGVLIIWDRLFGTCQLETGRVDHGLPAGSLSYDPFRLVMHGFLGWFRPVSSTTAIVGSTPVSAASQEKQEQAPYFKVLPKKHTI